MESEEKIIISDLEYLPPKRPTLTKIRNYGLPRSKQLWTRRTEYENWDWPNDVTQWGEDQIEWLSQELDRIYDGEWIYIDGKATYLNGMCYFFLQWFLLENEYYPEYRDTSLEYFRFVEIAERDFLCLGTILIKGRRLGASSMEASIQLRNGIIERNKRQGTISKTGTDASDIFQFIVSAFQALPVFLKPRIEGNEAGKSKLSIKKQAGRIKKDQNTGGVREGLNNEIDWRSTAANSYDSGKFLRILIDEAAKWEEVNIALYWKTVQKVFVKGAIVKGKAAIVSTVNRGDKGGDNFKTMWIDSDPAKRNELNQTSSRLFRIFIPAYRGYEGFIDQFGNSVVDTPTPEQSEYLKSMGCPAPHMGAREYLELQRKLNEHDPELLAEEIRTAPFTWEEVFSTATTLSHFRNVEQLKERLGQLEEKLIREGKNVLKDELGRRGKFVMMDDGRTKFVDDKSGLWYIDYLLPEEESNKFEFNKAGKKFPTNQSFGAAGWDTYSHSIMVGNKGSDACCMIRNRYSSLDPDNTGRPVAMFLGRLNTKKEVHEQLFWGLQYYGVELLGELAPSDWVEFAKDKDLKKNFEEYCIITQIKSDGTIIRGINAQNKEGREEHLTLMVEVAQSDVFKVPFIRLIRDRLAFDVNNRTDFDACMGDGYALMALGMPIKKKKVKRGEFKVLIKGRIIA